MTEIDNKLQEICAVNECYGDGKPKDIKRYDEHIAISFWECGAIVCIGDLLFFIGEDDGSWFNHDGMLDSFNIGWAESVINALTKLNEYVKENGTPVYYPNSDDISHYKL